MAIVAMQGRSDAKGTAWVLASATLESLRDITTVPRWKVEINNTYRLLETFSGSDYFSIPQPSLYPNTGRGPLVSGVGEQENIPSVATAIRSSLAEIFDGIDEEAAVATINNVLVSLYRENIGDAQQANMAKAISFFESMKAKLDPVR